MKIFLKFSKIFFPIFSHSLHCAFATNSFQFYSQTSHDVVSLCCSVKIVKQSLETNKWRFNYIILDYAVKQLILKI